MRIVSLEEIRQSLDLPQIFTAIEDGFVAYSKGETIVPNFTTLKFEKPPGDVHVKAGALKCGEYFVVKIASHLSHKGQGMMLLLSQQTGTPGFLLLDEGYLTSLRTAIAGAITAKYLAPKNISSIGVIGTGMQASMQLQQLIKVTGCHRIAVWGRDWEKVTAFSDSLGYEVSLCRTIHDLMEQCNIIVTTTSSSEPLILPQHLRPGMHITAVGADDIWKQEIHPHVFAEVDRIVVDSRSQCEKYGDIAQALEQKMVKRTEMIELGEVIQSPSIGRRSEDEITLTDLTGLAIQDLQIATTVIQSLKEA